MLKHKYSPITEHCQKYWTKTKTKIDNKNFIKIFSDMDQVEPCYTTNLKSPDSLRQQIDGSTDIEMAVTKVKTEQWKLFRDVWLKISEEQRRRGIIEYWQWVVIISKKIMCVSNPIKDSEHKINWSRNRKFTLFLEFSLVLRNM